MKMIVKTLLLSAALFTATPAFADGATPFSKAGKFGVGINYSNFCYVCGSAKYYLSDKLGVQAAVGLSSIGFAATVDGIYEMPTIWGNDAVSINWNLGGGLSSGFYKVGSVSGAIVGVAGIAGIGVQLKKFPLEFVQEIRPTFLVIPSDIGGFYFGYSENLRYWF